MVLRFGVSVLLFLVYNLLLFATLVRVSRLLIRWLHLSLIILVFVLSLLMLAHFTAFSLLWLLLLWHARSASFGDLVFLPKGLIHISVLSIASVFRRSAFGEGKLMGLIVLSLFIVTFLIRLVWVTLYLLSASRRISDFHLPHFSLQYPLSLIHFLSLTLFLLLLRTVVLFVESDRFTHIYVKSLLTWAHTRVEIIVVVRFALFIKDVHGLPLLAHSRLHLLATIIWGSFLQDCVIDFGLSNWVLHYAVDFSQVVQGQLVL